MRILVVSDTHYKTGRLEDLAENLKSKIEVVIHLGDAAHDAEFIKKQYNIATYSVTGNCDRDNTADKEKLIEIAGKKIFITHGHLYGVNTNPISVIEYAKEKGADICLFGHTHIPYLQIKSGF
ncbi:MAG: YfcE family phosphodiesterase, partial [Firmicutes bacterium]|nr:YfcE family phosphodiesterase [Bacillota bacterium]